MLRVLTFKKILFYAGNKKGRGLSPAAFLNYVLRQVKNIFGSQANRQASTAHGGGCK